MSNEKKANIITCFEYETGGRVPLFKCFLRLLGQAPSIAKRAQSYPKTLRQLGINRILHRNVVEWSDHVGSYGMGGPGFFGMKLTSTEQFAEEWLVLILWRADNWLLLDGRWVSAHPSQYPVQKPLYNSFAGGDQWDDLSAKLIDATVAGARIEDNATSIRLRKDDDEYLLEIPADTSRLPVRAGSGEQRVWYGHESQLDAWVVISAKADVVC